MKNRDGVTWRVETLRFGDGRYRVRVIDQAGRSASATGTDVGDLVTQCIGEARRQRLPNAYVEQPTL